MTIKLYLATSCLQTKPMNETVQQLLELNPYGLQLCGGNEINKGFKEWFLEQNIPYKIHHNFSWTQKVMTNTWQIKNDELVFNAFESDSVHPPMKRDVKDESLFWNFIEKNIDNLPILESMYPNDYYLCNDKDLNRVMDMGLKLAIDISHLHIQFCHGVLDNTTWLRVQKYNNIKEIHVSSNNGRYDSHMPLNKSTFGLQWAKEYANDNDMPIILECYMHKLTNEHRQEQVNFIYQL